MHEAARPYGLNVSYLGQNVNRDPKLGKRKQNESALIKYDLNVMRCICNESLNMRKTQMKATTKEKS